MNKSCFFLFVFFTPFLSFGQTKSIALKSHSGNSILSNIPQEDGNLGVIEPEMMMRMQKIEKINDSIIVFHLGRGNGAQQMHQDTIRNFPNWENPNLDSLKQLYGQDVELIGFKKQDKTGLAPIQQIKNGKGNRKQKKNEFIPITKATKSNSNISYLILGLIPLFFILALGIRFKQRRLNA